MKFQVSLNTGSDLKSVTNLDPNAKSFLKGPML